MLCPKADEAWEVAKALRDQVQRFVLFETNRQVLGDILENFQFRVVVYEDSNAIIIHREQPAVWRYGNITDQ